MTKLNLSSVERAEAVLLLEEGLIILHEDIRLIDRRFSAIKALTKELDLEVNEVLDNYADLLDQLDTALNNVYTQIVTPKEEPVTNQSTSEDQNEDQVGREADSDELQPDSAS